MTPFERGDQVRRMDDPTRTATVIGLSAKHPDALHLRDLQGRQFVGYAPMWEWVTAHYYLSVCNPVDGEWAMGVIPFGDYEAAHHHMMAQARRCPGIAYRLVDEHNEPVTLPWMVHRTPRPATRLSETSRNVHTYIGEYVRTQGLSPSFEEIAQAFKLSISNVSYHVGLLEAAGLIRSGRDRRGRRIPRSLTLVGASHETQHRTTD